MRRRSVLLLVVALLLPAARASAQTEAAPFTVTSPSGDVALTIALTPEGAATYEVAYRGKTLVAPSALGLQLRGGLLQTGLRVTGVRRSSHDETWPLVVGKAKAARDHYAELVVSLEQTGGAGRKLDVVARAYDDGAAFRYAIPDQNGLSTVEIVSERTEFRFPTDLSIWALQLPSFRTSYEGEFDRLTSSRVAPSATLGLPLVARARDGSAAFAITEADLADYAGMYLTGLASGYGVAAKLAPRREGDGLAVRATMGPKGVASPWRVVMIAAEPVKLVESTLVANLSAPNAIGDASWVRPGKSAWDWWSGPAKVGVADAGMNDETMRHYVDFASKMGFEYMLVDAGWYAKGPAWGPQMDPKADITKTIPEIHMPELVAYAKERKVGIWVWINWALANDQMDVAFSRYEDMGIKGVKIDFMDSDDQYMVDFYHRVLATAAKHRLMVDLHGAYKPTGLARTYPNYVTQEGVMGAEYNKWSARVTATHNVTLAFTRLLVGPMDYTPGAFRNRAPETFEIRGEQPQVMTTRAHGLAMYVVYESPFACVSDDPEAYDAGAGADFLRAVPTSWDETRGVAGEIGEYVVVARRKGADWYLGAMNAERPREIEVPLAFLGGGRFRATVFADGAKRDDAVVTTSTVEGGTMKLALAGGGGAAVRFEAVR